jgi:hypothetical protein
MSSFSSLILLILPPPFCHVGGGLSISLMFSKNELFVSFDSLYSLCDFNLIDLGPDLYYFSPSVGLGLGLFLFFQEVKVHH